jgi:hypothetical protein
MITLTNEYKCVLHEVLVAQERSEEASRPLSSDGHRGVMSIVGFENQHCGWRSLSLHVLIFGVMNIHCGSTLLLRSS